MQYLNRGKFTTILSHLKINSILNAYFFGVCNNEFRSSESSSPSISSTFRLLPPEPMLWDPQTLAIRLPILICKNKKDSWGGERWWGQETDRQRFLCLFSSHMHLPEAGGYSHVGCAANSHLASLMTRSCCSKKFRAWGSTSNFIEYHAASGQFFL